MATTAVLPAIATSYGGTIVQANSLVLPAATEYEKIDWEAAQARAKQLGGAKRFWGFPDTPKRDIRYTWYSRKDIVSAAAPAATLVAVIVNTVNETIPLPDSISLLTTMIVAEVKAWHIQENTDSGGTKYTKVIPTGAMFSAMRDPDGAALIIATSAYQAFQETTSFLFKPVAAGAPLYDPFYAAVLGLNPNV
jgi:hypothetical protein